MQNCTGFSDIVVSHLSTECKKREIELFFVFPGCDDFTRLLRLNGYSHFKDPEHNNLRLDYRAVGFRNLIEEIVEDFRGLCPEFTGFITAEGRCSEFSSEVERIIKDEGLKFHKINAADVFISAEQFLTEGQSQALDALDVFNEEIRKSTDAVSFLRRMINMSSLSADASSAGMAKLNSLLIDLSENYERTVSLVEGLKEASAGICDTLWIELYTRAALLFIEEEILSIKTRLKQSGLLN